MNRSTLALCFTLALLFVGLTDTNAFGQPHSGEGSFWINDGNNATIFPRGRINRLGYQISVRLSAPDIPETQRVEIEFTSTGGPTTADHNFTLVLAPRGNGHSPPQSALEVEIPFRIPENSTQQTIIRHVPKTSYGDLYDASILEDGRAITDIPNEIGKALQRYTANRFTPKCHRSMKTETSIKISSLCNRTPPMRCRSTGGRCFRSMRSSFIVKTT